MSISQLYGKLSGKVLYKGQVLAINNKMEGNMTEKPNIMLIVTDPENAHQALSACVALPRRTP